MKGRKPVDHRFRDLAYEALEPYSRAFLAMSGLREGIRVLEVGCGAGGMTPWLSRTVGRSGRVVALDIDPEQVERARRNVRESGLDNVDVVEMSVDDVMELGGEFDLVYGRFLLMQLPNPFGTLERLLSCVRPGGIVALDEPNQEADLAVPPCPPCEQANRIFLEFADRVGIDFRVGDRLYSMLLRLGARIRVAHVCQPIIPVRDAVQMFAHGLLDSESTLLESGVVTQEMFEQTLAALEAWPASETDCYALSRQVQISAERV